MEARKRTLTDTSRRKTSVLSPAALSNKQQQIFTMSSQQYTGMEPTVHLLNYELYVASIPKDSLSSATHSLLQIMLRLFQEDSDCRRNHFFSFTETSTEYSVILDKDLLETTPSNVFAVLRPTIPNAKIELAKAKWRALVVEVGALGSLTGISSIVASVIGPLANCGVSVFCLSTNLDDFVLVKDEDLERALTCLSWRFRLMCDSERKLDLALVQSVVQRATFSDPPNDRKHSVAASCEVHSRPITHPYFCSSSQYSICGVIPRALPSIGTSLLQLMLFNHRRSSDETFLSFSIVEDDISVVLDERDIARFPEGTLYLNKETWRLIRIGEGQLGFDECGIVAQVSAPLAQADISTYYISTYNTDHTLVREENADNALKLLNDRYVSKVIKKMRKNKLSESSLCSNTFVAASLSDSDLCAGSSYASLTDSSICANNFSSALQEAN